MSLTPPDARAAVRLAWARHATGDPKLELQRASVDAGFRSYWRGGLETSAANRNAGAASVIVMDSPPELEDPAPWLRIREMLAAGGVRVPGVLAQDVAAGFLLLQDLGTDTYLHVIAEHNADALFDDAVTQLLRIQAIDASKLPAYDEAFLAREAAHVEGFAKECAIVTHSRLRAVTVDGRTTLEPDPESALEEELIVHADPRQAWRGVQDLRPERQPSRVDAHGGGVRDH